MIVSWNWLKDYIPLEMDAGELADRLSMAGLNHESTQQVGNDLAIDLEVTSNRPDCLGHIGVAREISVLWDRSMNIPAPQPQASSVPVGQLTRVTLQCPDLCYQYTARVIRGVKVGASPDWLAQRLQSIGLAVVNNIVDITNYVLMECGQPLHAFDLARLNGAEIIVRRARLGETLEAIDHKTYALDGEMCLIADAALPVALGGVMGGAATEVSLATRDLLIESAEFAPLAIRTTARKLKLHSPSSYRFERGVDPEGVDWASRRCCELILDLAGGELAEGVINVGRDLPPRQPITLRLSQLKRILGIDIPADEVRRILTALGGREIQADRQRIQIEAPSWRRDLMREIDLVEEVARIHGYDEIPEDVGVPMAPSHRSDEDRVLDNVRRVLTAAGFDEAMTTSVVPRAWSDACSPWTGDQPIQCGTPMLKGADQLRLSLIPSLLSARQINESLSNPRIELFETARIYIPQGGQLPREQRTLGLTSGGDYYLLKGVVESLLEVLNPRRKLNIGPLQLPLLDPVKSSSLLVDGQRLGYLGELAGAALKQFGLRGTTTVAELDLGILVEMADLIRQHSDQIPYPAISRDLNFVVPESLRWTDLEQDVQQAGGPLLESLRYQETYRNVKADGPGKKRILINITLRSPQTTLTREEAEEVTEAIIQTVHRQHAGRLLG